MNCMAKEILDQGKTVLYVDGGSVFKMIEEQRLGNWRKKKRKII